MSFTFLTAQNVPRAPPQGRSQTAFEQVPIDTARIYLNRSR
jgi:hypothetical protein